MAIGSTLTKGVRRTWENNKPKLQKPSSDSSKTSSSYKKPTIQGDSDSEVTSPFSSSVHGSTSSGTSSTSRYSSGIEGGGKHQRKTLDNMNSQKVAASGSMGRRLQSQSRSLPNNGYGLAATRHRPQVDSSDASPDLQKPVPKFTRSGSLRSLKILRKKNTPPSESNKSSTVKDLHSKKATFSSSQKDSKFPEQVEPQAGAKESEEALSPAKLCSYEHCSLHGHHHHHHHHHEPPLKRFSFLKRRSSKDQKSINPQIQPTDKRPVKKKEDKINKKVSNKHGKEKDVDYSIEFYAKTRAEPSFEPNCSQDDLYLADIMFGVNDNNSNNRMSMWRLIHHHMVSGNIEQQLQEEQPSSFDDDDVANKGKEFQKMFAIKKIVREAIEKILLPEEDGSEKNQEDDQTEPNDQAAGNMLGTKNDKPKGWSYVKKVVLMRRFITELEKANKKLGPDKRGHVLFAPEPEPEAEIVSLRSQTTGERKDSNEWMLDYALQQVVAELAPTQKRKVALLVKSFEMISPKLDKRVAV